MDWFQVLAGFREESYSAAQAQLKISDGRLKSLVNGRSYEIGELELVSLHELRRRAISANAALARLRTSIVEGDVRKLHAASEFEGALFQVASQFNALEMVGPNVTPEDAVTRYEDGHT
jgi:hypothetical protein